MKVEDIFSEFPTLETDRLILRKLTKNDLDDLFEYTSNSNVAKYVTWHTHNTKEDTLKFIDFVLNRYEMKIFAPWGIELKENLKIIGTIDFVNWNLIHRCAEIGYALSNLHWGKGYMSEAAHAVLQFGFAKMNLERIEAKCFTDNSNSQRVMEKIGMTYEGTMRKRMYVKDRFWDVRLFAILKEEYENNRNASKKT